VYAGDCPTLVYLSVRQSVPLLTRSSSSFFIFYCYLSLITFVYHLSHEKMRQIIVLFRIIRSSTPRNRRNIEITHIYYLDENRIEFMFHRFFRKLMSRTKKSLLSNKYRIDCDHLFHKEFDGVNILFTHQISLMNNL
jgi:hypothetical protein